jgi:hypothetical protein
MDEDDRHRELDPEDLADPCCIDCGGKGGWLGEGERWVWCDCIDWDAA